MSEVWSYLSGSKRRARNAASLSKQSSCCISDTTADGSPTAGFLASASLKAGSTASSDWRRSMTDDRASLAARSLLSPASAPSIAASSSLFSPVTVQTELPLASSVRSSGSRGGTASWLSSHDGGGSQAHEGRSDAVHAAAAAAASPAASYLAATPPMASVAKSGASEMASPLSEWNAYTTPGASRQPTRDYSIGGESPQWLANLNTLSSDGAVAGRTVGRQQSGSGLPASAATSRSTSSRSLQPQPEPAAASVRHSRQPTISSRAASVFSPRSAAGTRRSSTIDRTPADSLRQTAEDHSHAASDERGAVGHISALPFLRSSRASQEQEQLQSPQSAIERSERIDSGSEIGDPAQPGPPGGSAPGDFGHDRGFEYDQPPWRQEAASSPSPSLLLPPPPPPLQQTRQNQSQQPQQHQPQQHQPPPQQQQQQQEPSHDWLPGSSTSHADKRQLRWQQQLATPHEQWTSSQVRIRSLTQAAMLLQLRMMPVTF